MSHETDESLDSERSFETALLDTSGIDYSEASSVDSKRHSIEGFREIQGLDGFYNAAVWTENGKTYLWGRQVETAGKEGQPDIGSLVLKTLGPHGEVASSKELWKPGDSEYLLEDPRALQLPDGRIAFGLTAVDHVDDDYIPYPAVLITSTKELMGGDFPEPIVIRTLGSGDQTMPLGKDVSYIAGKNVTSLGPNLFAFRQEDDNHRLKVFEYRGAGEDIAYSQDILLPKNIPWAQFKIGTTTSPIWLNEHEAVLLIHGIRRTENNKLEYSIGSSRLLKDEKGILSIDNISPEPLIYPDLFNGPFDTRETELHEERRVVYLCGALAVRGVNDDLEYIKAYPNVGDKRTVEVILPVVNITKGWKRHNPTEPEISRVA